MTGTDTSVCAPLSDTHDILHTTPRTHLSRVLRRNPRCEVSRNDKRFTNKRVHQVVTDTVRPTVTTTVVPNTHFVLVGLSHCFTVPYPCKVRKITSHQRNSKEGLFVYTSLSTCLCTLLFPQLCTTLLHSLSHKTGVFSFCFLR
jgi:hypothetical protein